MTEVHDLQAHVERLCQEHNILWRADREDSARAFRDTREIHTPPIRSVVTYGIALYEIGHFLGRYQDSKRGWIREVYAWIWARQNALEWTRDMSEWRKTALIQYEQYEAGAELRKYRAKIAKIMESD
jgi:hypothetical protein